MSFPNGIEPTLARVHPTPLYELLAGLIIGYFLWRRGAKPHATGAIVGQYLILTVSRASWWNSFAATPKSSGDCRMRNLPAPAPSSPESSSSGGPQRAVSPTPEPLPSP